MNQAQGSKLQLPPSNKLKAVEGLLMLSGAYVRQDVLKSLTNAITAKCQEEASPCEALKPTKAKKLATTMSLQEKKDMIWKVWESDIKGWRRMMTKHLLDEKMYNKLKQYYFRARKMLKEELEKTTEEHTYDPAN